MVRLRLRYWSKQAALLVQAGRAVGPGVSLTWWVDDAIDSVCRNIAEGFGCKDKEFARFLRIARRSLNEVRDELHSAGLKEDVTDADLVIPRMLMRRLYPAFSSLLRYLEPGPDDRKSR